MNLILRYLEGRKAVPTTADPHLKAELNQTKKDLNQILNKWKFGDTPLTTAQEFLANFEPWITDQLNQQKELKVFLAKHGLHNLTEIKNVNLPESESDQLKFYRENIQIKEEIINEYKEAEQTWQHTEEDYLRKIEELKAAREISEQAETIKQELIQAKELWKNTEQDYLTQIANQDQELKDKVKEFQASNGELLKRIEELKANPGEDHSNPFELESLRLEIKDLKKQLAIYEKGEDWESQTASVITSLEQEVSDLTTERDAAIREKQTAEQDLLATNNRLKNKSQEAEAKANQIKLLKKEKSQSEIALNKTITELRTKYSKQGKLLDTEQLECKKLEEENEKLKAEIQQLKGGSH